MFAQIVRRYTFTCGLLLLPILAGNAAFVSYLPPAISDPALWGAIPQPLAMAENALRVLLFAVPFFVPLQLSTRRQQVGLTLYIIGALVYAGSWLALIALPHSSWAASPAGFLAPAYTPALWLAGLSLLGKEFSWGGNYRPWMYATLCVLFLAVHISHATIVYTSNYRDVGANPSLQRNARGKLRQSGGFRRFVP